MNFIHPFGLSPKRKNQKRSVKAELFFCGGHGGLVTYDGAGGAMVKEGGPMDRLFVLRRDRLGGNSGLDIVYGSIRFSTGPLRGSVDLIDKGKSPIYSFIFEGNPDDHAIEIRGSIPELGISRDTILYHSTVEASQMIWHPGAKGSPPTLPYVALHLNPVVHPRILERFELSGAIAKDADTAWCKLAPQSMNSKKITRLGVGFRTQQHLGYLRAYLY